MAEQFTVNYDDERFGKVESDKQQAMTELENVYGGMINDTDKYYQAQIDASKQWADTQSKLQQEQTDFAIEQIEQQKDQANKDYLKEQSGAYVDWQKQSNQYGANAEAKAAQGMQNTGYSESSQVAMYTAYQNRVSVARDSYNRAVLNYDNAIKDARLQNNAALAEIALESLQKQLELSLAGFQYKNQLVLDKANQKINLENNYYNRYLDVLNQINTENAMAEEIRQYNESMAFEREQFEWEKAKSGSGGGGGSYYTLTEPETEPVTGNTTGTSYHGINQQTADQLQTQNNYKKANEVLSGMSAIGASQTQLLAKINDAEKNGALTAAQAKKLKEQYASR